MTSLSLAGPSSLDLFYRSNSALKICFEEYLAVPVSDYHVVPMTTCCEFLYALTMLPRWARLVGPPVPAGMKGAAGIHDTPKEPGVRAETANFRVRGEDPLGGGEDRPSPLSRLQLRPTADPAIPAAVAALRQQLRQQEGLALDIGGILKTAVAKFEK